MDRRGFLKGTAMAGPGAALAAPALAQGGRELAMVTAWARGAPGVHDSAARVAQAITTMSEGALTVTLYPAGDRVGAFEVFETVSAGQADMYHAADYFFTSHHPAFSFFTATPFGMTAPEMAVWYDHGGGRQLHAGLGRRFNLRPFLAGNTGAQSGGWFRKPILTPRDLSGLRLNYPGLGGQVMERLGAVAETWAGADVPAALASGALDGTEWVGAWADEAAGLDQAASVYYPAGFHEPAAALTLAVNAEVFDDLTLGQQRIIEVASAECHQWSLGQFTHQNAAAYQSLQQKGIVPRAFPDPVWDAFGEAAVEVMSTHMGDDLFGEIFDSVRASMLASSAWIGATDGHFRAQRDRILG